MSLSFILGNLFGRATISYLLVLFICWLASKLQWRSALTRSRRWYRIVAVIVLTLMGMGVALVKAGGV